MSGGECKPGAAGTAPGFCLQVQRVREIILDLINPAGGPTGGPANLTHGVRALGSYRDANSGTGQYAQEPVCGELFQNALHLAACGGFQAGAHQLHTVEIGRAHV